MNQKIISVLLILMMIATVLAKPVYAEQSFVDVPSTAEAFDEINFLVNEKVINGYTENGKKYFKPFNQVTRWQAAKMVVNASGNEPLKVLKSSFTDVAVGTEASLYIERAAQLGFFETDGSGKFYPHKPLTRGEMSYVLTKAFQLNTSMYNNLPIAFEDISSNHYYKPYINAIYYNGIAKGSNGKFMPDAFMTRTQFSLFVARAMSEKFSLPIPSQIDTTQVIGLIEVTTDGLNVRTSPNASNDSNVIGQVNTGGKLSVYEVEGSWLKVSYKGVYAYISKAYAKFLDSDGKALGAVQQEVTANSALNVHYKSSSSSKLIGTITKGATLPVYKQVNGYYLTIVNGLPGYVVASATTSKAVSPTTPTVGNEQTTTGVKGRVTVSSLTVRAQANSSSATIGSLTKDTYVQVQSISGFWAKIQYNGGTGYVHKSYLKLINTASSAVKGRIIVLDPGHGGKDPGAVNGSTTEKSIVLKVSNIVKQKLEADGAKVIMTRDGDTYPTLPDRVKITNDNFAELFISIHVNASTSSAASGAETYYNVSTGDSYQEEAILAKLINDEIVKQANMRDRGVKTANYYVISQNVIPSILVELGFISNTSDLEKLTSSKYIDIYAKAIYDGIIQYYEKQ